MMSWMMSWMMLFVVVVDPQPEAEKTVREPTLAGPDPVEQRRATAPIPAPDELARALASLPSQPTVEQVQQAAARRMVVSPRTARRWILRARAAAALPDIGAQLDLENDRTWNLDEEAGTADALSTDLGTGMAMRLRADWRLDRLLFNADELRAARAALDVQLERERMLVEVTQLYFSWLKLLLDERLGDRGGVDAAMRTLQIREIAAILNGMTGLHFDTRPRQPMVLPRRAPERPPGR